MTLEVSVDTTALGGEEGRELDELVHRAGLPAAGSTRSATHRPDAFRHFITVDDGQRSSTTVVSDPVPPALSPLIADLRKRARHQR